MYSAFDEQNQKIKLAFSEEIVIWYWFLSAPSNDSLLSCFLINYIHSDDWWSYFKTKYISFQLFSTHNTQ